VALLDAVAVRDNGSGAVTLFAVNRDQRQEVTLDVDLRACPDLVSGEHLAVHDRDPDAVNTADQPDRVTPRRLDDAKVVDGHAAVVLPPLSWSMVRLQGGR
jgi:alpha-N-arabinofuranosidase